MKYATYFFIIVLVLSFFEACKNQQNEKSILIIKNGLIYKTGSSVPFTGREIARVKQRTIIYDVLDGKKTGEFKILFLDGKPEIIGQMVNNSNEGLWKYFYPNSQIENEGNFKNNMVEGKWIWYYEDGSLKEVGNYVNGKREGEWISYKEDGKILEKKTFKDGKEVQTLVKEKIKSIKQIN